MTSPLLDLFREVTGALGVKAIAARVAGLTDSVVYRIQGDKERFRAFEVHAWIIRAMAQLGDRHLLDWLCDRTRFAVVERTEIGRAGKPRGAEELVARALTAGADAQGTFLRAIRDGVVTREELEAIEQRAGALMSLLQQECATARTMHEAGGQ